jgi:hypothetical protein
MLQVGGRFKERAEVTALQRGPDRVKYLLNGLPPVIGQPPLERIQ